MKPTNRNAEQGFTLVELTVVLAAMVPILIAILGTTKSVRNAVTTTTQLTELAGRVDLVADRFGQLMKETVGSTVTSQATQADVDAAVIEATLALPDILLVPAIGDWIVPAEFRFRTTLQFHTVSTQLSINASKTVGPFILEHLLSPGELRNGVDDDGDGLIDEGDLVLRGPTADTVAIQNVEKFEADVVGSLVILRIDGAKEDKEGRIYRIHRQRRFVIRNK